MLKRLATLLKQHLKQHGCFPEGLLHLLRALFNRGTSEALLLQNRCKPGLNHDENF